MQSFSLQEQRFLLIAGFGVLLVTALTQLSSMRYSIVSSDDPSHAEITPSSPRRVAGVLLPPSREHPVNPNYATYEELVQIPGIGPTRARAIVLHRETSLFFHLNDLNGVRGIGPKTIEAIAPYLTFTTPDER